MNLPINRAVLLQRERKAIPRRESGVVLHVLPSEAVTCVRMPFWT